MSASDVEWRGPGAAPRARANPIDQGPGGIRDLANRQRHSGFGSERSDGGMEVEAVTLVDIADGVAVRLTAEAVIVPVFEDRDARRLLGMERTTRDELSPAAFQLGVPTDQGSDGSLRSAMREGPCSLEFLDGIQRIQKGASEPHIRWTGAVYALSLQSACGSMPPCG